MIKTGRMLNPNFTDYKVPRAKDMPKVESIIVEDPEPSGPFGAKGVGEIGIAPAPGAITNAIYEATGCLDERPSIHKRKSAQGC